MINPDGNIAGFVKPADSPLSEKIIKWIEE